MRVRVCLCVGVCGRLYMMYYDMYLSVHIFHIFHAFHSDARLPIIAICQFMFQNAFAFDQPIGAWNTSLVTNMAVSAPH